MNSIKIAKQILILAKQLMAMEFDTEEEKKKYEQEHDVRPGTKLTVNKTEKSPGTEQPKQDDKKPAGRDTRYLQKIKDNKESVFDVAEMLSDAGGIKPRMVDDKLGRGSQKVTYDYQKRSSNLRPMSLTVEVSPKPKNDGLTVSFFNHETNKPYGTNKRVKTVEFKGEHTLENSVRKIQDMVNGFIG